MIYLGDLVEDASVTFRWNTCDAGGASITRATDGTIKVIRDDDTDCTGTSVTDDEDNPLTGIHKCTIDTSDNANYATGHDYTVYVEAMTVDGQVINAAIVHFSICNRHGFSAGGTECTYTLTDEDTGLPIADADVWVTTDIENTNVIENGKTDQNGKVTFYLDLGATVYIWRQKSGYNFDNPDTEVVS